MFSDICSMKSSEMNRNKTKNNAITPQLFSITALIFVKRCCQVETERCTWIRFPICSFVKYRSCPKKQSYQISDLSMTLRSAHSIHFTYMYTYNGLYLLLCICSCSKLTVIQCYFWPNPWMSFSIVIIGHTCHNTNWIDCLMLWYVKNN